MTCRTNCDLLNGTAQVGVRDNLLEPDVDHILGNDLVPGEAVSAAVLTGDPTPDEYVREKDKPTFPVCAESRSALRMEESWGVTAEAIQDTPSDPRVENVNGDVESPDELLLTNKFSETLNEFLLLLEENVVAERFEI